jgi:MFS transporter, DHA3 family, macrolide efflux protein
MPNNQAAPRGMRTFFVIWLGQFVSLIGSGLTSFGLAVWIFEQTRQATPFAITALFATLPRLVLTPVAGALADRLNRRWLMIVADTGSALVTLSAAGLLWTGQLEVWHIYLVATANSVFGAFQEPAYLASIAMLVPRKHLARANGMGQLSQAVEMMAAPALAGVLFVTVGLSGIILIDFATFIVALGTLLVVRIPQPPAEARSAGQAGARASLLADAAYGWHYLRARRGLFVLLVYFALVNYLLNTATVLAGPLVLSMRNASVLGLVQMTAGTGMLVGSLVVSAWGGPKRRIWGVIGAIALSSAGLALAGLRPSPVFVAAGLFVLLFCIPIASSASQAIFQSKVAPAVQGRVFAMRGLISRSMTPLAFFSSGLLADGLFEPLMQPAGALGSGLLGSLLGAGSGRGVGLMFVLSGLLLVAASVGALASRSVRNIERELPDMLPDEPPAVAAVPEMEGSAPVEAGSQAAAEAVR